MSSILKKALIPAIIIEVFLLIFCQFVTEIDELSFTILILALLCGCLQLFLRYSLI